MIQNKKRFLYSRIGDIVFIRKKPSWVIGRFKHCGIFLGKTEKYNIKFWEREEERWIGKDERVVVHSTTKSKSGSGLGYSTYKNFIRDAKEVALGYVKSAKICDCMNVCRFIVEQLNFQSGRPCGPHYDRGWLCKQTTVYKRNPVSLRKGYYCSEMVWGAYKEICKIDLDNRFDWKTLWGVSPDDIYNSEEVEIYFHDKKD